MKYNMDQQGRIQEFGKEIIHTSGWVPEGLAPSCDRNGSPSGVWSFVLATLKFCIYLSYMKLNILLTVNIKTTLCDLLT